MQIQNEFLHMLFKEALVCSVAPKMIDLEGGGASVTL